MMHILLATLLATVSASIGSFIRDTHEVEDRIRSVLARATDETSVSGVVTCVGRDGFFVQDGDVGLKVLLEKGAFPSVGDKLEIWGRPTIEGGRILLSSTSWKRIGKGEMPPPASVDADELTFADSGANWRLVDVEGVVMGHTESGFSLEVGELLLSVCTEESPLFLLNCEQLHPRVRVRGVAELFLDQGALAGRHRYVIGVRICAPDAAAFALLPDAAYQLRLHEQEVKIASFALVGILLIGLGVLWQAIVRHRKISYSTAMVMADRKRMADDLHDTIEQHLAGAGMLIKIARMPSNSLPPAAERPLREAQDVLVRAKREMRDIVWGLKNDDMMRLTPAEMLRELANGMTRQGMFRVRTRLVGMPDSLPGGAIRDLSLIVREAIGNAVKHGGADKVAITGDSLEGGWLLRIANNGKPFDPDAAPGAEEGHFGIAGMRQRARRIGAELTFGRKGKWTVLSLRWGQK